QDNGTWGGPSRTRFRDGATKSEWFKIHTGDGFGAAVDPSDRRTVYATSQFGGLVRVDAHTLMPNRVARPGTVDGTRVQFNWDTPFFVSPHNHNRLFFAGNFAFRSFDRGAHTDTISGKLSRTDQGTATVFTESPRQPGLLYAGTDDGAAWVSRDDGKRWRRIDGNLPKVAGPRYVSVLQPSAHADGRVFLALDGHRSNDFATHLFVSNDYGASWSALGDALPPNQPVRGFCEDPRNSRLLFAGTEFGCYASLDRGRSWHRLGEGLPTVPVHDLVIQDRDAELVAATHGRGLFVLEIEPLRQLTRTVLAGDAELLAPHAAYLWCEIERPSVGHKIWHAPQAPYGSSIFLYHGKAPSEVPEVTITDLAGKELARLKGAKVAGVQRIVWNARRTPERSATTRGPRTGRGAGRGEGRAGPRTRTTGRRAPLGPRVPPGTYRVSYTFAGKTTSRALELLPDPLSADTTRHPLRRIP
ncbi:MAG: hypothetical protein KDC87_04060, partial [Planctomycetes bacterium]|nr:hypothetical protein [Planctomycetota bacterium]